MNGGSFLVDTNLLVYAHDRSEYKKQMRAREVLAWLGALGAGMLNTQVLAEFFWAVTRKLKEPISEREAYKQLEGLARSWSVLGVTPAIVLESARGCLPHRFSFWDAQIWATAKLNQIPQVLIEDFSHGRRIEGVKFVNPFIADLA